MAFAVVLLMVPISLSTQAWRGDRNVGAPKRGDLAPIFKLKSVDGSLEVDIGSLVGTKPIVLIFGSYT